MASDVAFLAPRLRKEDVAEIQAFSGSTALEALQVGLTNSTKCFTMECQNVPFGMFGAVPSGRPGVGFMWMLGSDDVIKYRTRFLRESPRWVEELHKDFPALTNFVDARNGLHIKWLAWVGCRFLKVHPEFGLGRLPFIEFVHTKDN